MTTNQTIDGVPRALLEDLASYGEKWKVPEPWMVDELRALLASPVVRAHGDPGVFMTIAPCTPLSVDYPNGITTGYLLGAPIPAIPRYDASCVEDTGDEYVLYSDHLKEISRLTAGLDPVASERPEHIKKLISQVTDISRYLGDNDLGRPGEQTLPRALELIKEFKRLNTGVRTQPQGELVAYRYKELQQAWENEKPWELATVSLGRVYLERKELAERGVLVGKERETYLGLTIEPLYAGPARTSSVVLPERSNERDHAGDFTYEAKAWNACLEEVKRLNK